MPRFPSWEARKPVHASKLRRSTKKKRVLFVDDDDMLSSVLGGLEKDYEIATARNGVEALARLRENPPHLVVTTVTLPMMDGFELLEAIRNDPDRRWIPVVLFSAGGEEAPWEGLDAETDDLVKPFWARALETKARSLLTLSELRHEVGRARKAVRMRDEFLSMVAHELRTSLTPLTIQLRRLARLAGAGAARLSGSGSLSRLARLCDVQVEQLATLVDELLDVGRMWTGHVELRRTDTNVSRLLASVAEHYRFPLEEVGSVLHLAIAPNVCARVDGTRLAQVVAHLLTNAMRHARGAGVELALEDHGNTLQLSVTDTGPGIPVGHQERIFRRFEDGVASVTGGLGLGLFLSREIVRAHGGEITVESAAGAGARFVVELPKALPLVAMG